MDPFSRNPLQPRMHRMGRPAQQDDQPSFARGDLSLDDVGVKVELLYQVIDQGLIDELSRIGQSHFELDHAASLALRSAVGGYRRSGWHSLRPPTCSTARRCYVRGTAGCALSRMPCKSALRKSRGPLA